jgi:hypothetical protein
MRRLILVTLLIACACGCEARGAARAARAPLVVLEEVRYRAGDDPAWSSPGYPDSAWTRVDFNDVVGTDGIYWLRASFQLEPRHLTPGRPFGLQFGAMATAGIWWDGVRLPSAGRVGATAAEESPGPIFQTIHVPNDMAAPGSHTVALRLSSHHRGFEPTTGFWLLALGDYERLTRFQPAYAATALISLSGMVIVGLYFLALFALNRRQTAHLLLGLLCAAAAALLVAEAWRPLLGYTYDWHIVRLRVVTGLTYGVNVLLIGSVIAMFPLRGWRIVLPVAAALLTAPMFRFASWDPKQLGMFLIGLTVALSWAVFASVRRQAGAVFAALGLAGCMAVGAIRPVQFVDQVFFIVLDVLLIGLLVAHAFQVRRTQQERQRALLKSARLEAELLRRHIQPHFLMNTLTALNEWVEEDPAVASNLIHALADEFRALSAIADRPMVPVADEIRRCESHNEVMSLRKGCKIQLLTEGLDPAAMIPPAVFHTLVENAITHAPNAAEVEMHLRAEAIRGEVRYLFEAPAGTGASATGPEGTGLRYVRSRLEEAFGQTASLHRAIEGTAYRTEIVVPAGGP